MDTLGKQYNVTTFLPPPPPPNVLSPINKSLLTSPQLEFGKNIASEEFFYKKIKLLLLRIYENMV